MKSSESQVGLQNSVHASSSVPPGGVAARPRMPLVGMILGLAFVGGLAAWTVQRVKAAQSVQQAVEQKRSAEQQRAKVQASAPEVVRVILGKPETWQPTVQFEGTLQASQQAELGFKTGGRLGSIKGKLGDVVKAGAVLATLDTNEAAAQLKAANAQLRAAEAQLALAADSEQRTQKLLDTGSVAAATGVQTTQQRALAEAQLDAARAQIGVVQVSLYNHVLVAPFAGTLTRAPDGVGAVVTPGQVLFALADLRSLKLRGTISEPDANLLKLGSSVEVDGGGPGARGKITALIGIVDASTRRVPIEAVLENASGSSLRAGSFVRAQALGGAPIQVLRLPHEALRHGSQDEVFVVSNGALQARKLVFSVSKDGALLVRSGLQPNEPVVLSPRAEARSGAKVNIEAGSERP
ncbi:MAG TPA: efflux RND transporter periplasmic adaptor subunit [Polyangiaceae bacterium]|nr:efflux RND transporter periplasmic adaptor subunit [Polyangiaceae bacterium]